MANINDPRSTVGRYLRGNNVYGGGGNSPNPRGNNQYPKDLQAAARLRRMRNKKARPQPPYPTLLTDAGGNYT